MVRTDTFSPQRPNVRYSITPPGAKQSDAGGRGQI
jgi:hypothetical protein